MTDRTNLFAEVTTVGALFDALWYNATQVVTANVDPETPYTEYLRRAREIAIGDAHKRCLELTGKE